MIVVVGYVGVSVYFGVRHLLGDSGSHPAAYFFTWDMFPGYATESSRRTVLGVTRSERHVQLLPGPDHHFRWGINNEVRRIDIDRRKENLLPAIERQVDRYNEQHPRDPVEKVMIVEQFWPARFNLPDDLYEAEYGVSNPRRKYWRILDYRSVSFDGKTLESDPP